jgi:hypothetical protein
MRFGLLPVCVLFFALASVVLPAESSAQSSGVHKHDGFMLRLGVGAGYSSSTAEEGGVEIEVSGAGIAPIFLDVGGSVGRNFNLHFSAAGWTSIDPDLTLSSGGESMTVGSDDLSARLLLLGLGGTYYFAGNSFLTIILGTTQFSLQDESDSDNTWETDWGFGGRALFGKEWWASDNWGLGIAGYLDASSNPDSTDSEVKWMGLSLGLVFSATYQ